MTLHVKRRDAIAEVQHVRGVSWAPDSSDEDECYENTDFGSEFGGIWILVGTPAIAVSAVAEASGSVHVTEAKSEFSPLTPSLLLQDADAPGPFHGLIA